jgi:hypothetical protein
MNELLNISGRPIDARSLPKFTWNADLIYFDGPMLSLFKQDDGQDVLFSWLDCDNRKNRWCIVPIPRESLRLYLAQTITLRSIFLAAPNTLVFHTGKDAKRRNFALLSSLPEEYLPSHDSYLVDQISTPAAKRLATEATQDVELGLNGELYLEDMEGIPKLYQQLYSFHYGMEHLDRPAVRDEVQTLMTRWRGGIGAVNLFSGLKNVTPSIHRARLLRLHYASPGHIKLNLLPTLAEKIRIAMSRIVEWDSFSDTEELYRDIYRYFKEHQIGGFDDERAVVEMDLPQHQVNDLMFFIDRFLSIIGWNSYRGNFVTLEMTAISQLRMLLAYYRRLRKLRDFVISGKLSLEGQFPFD